MLKVFKWEFLKRLKDLRVFYIVLIGIVIINLLLPSELLQNTKIVAAVSSIYGVMLFAIICIYSIVAVTADLRSPHMYLEKSIAKKPWELISGKLINNFIYLIILYGLTLLLARIINRFATETNSYMEVNIPFNSILIMGIVLPLTVLFFYLLAISMPFTRSIPILATTVFIVGICVILSRIIVMPIINNLLAGKPAVTVLIFFVLSLGLFLGSCRLYENYYEVR